MSWILPTLKAFPVGKIRVVTAEPGNRDIRAYDRAYYHNVRKLKRKPPILTPEQKARRAQQAKERYAKNKAHFQALARANYWRHREEYRTKAAEKAREKRSRNTGETSALSSHSRTEAKTTEFACYRLASGIC